MPNITIGHSPRPTKAGNPSQTCSTKWHVLIKSKFLREEITLCSTHLSLPIIEKVELPQESFGKVVILENARDKIPKRYRLLYPDDTWEDFYTCEKCYKKINPKPKPKKVPRKPRAKKVDSNQLNLW